MASTTETPAPPAPLAPDHDPAPSIVVTSPMGTQNPSPPSSPLTSPPPTASSPSSSPPKIPITLTGVSETMLATLTGRALDASKPPSQRFLNDTWAKTVLDQLDYKGHNTHTDKIFYQTILLRAKQFDIWTREFLDAHPEGATVLHLACGLDSRALRVWAGRGEGEGEDGNGGSGRGFKGRWIDVDLPEVVEVRKRVVPVPEGGGGGEYTLLGVSVTDEGWLEEIQNDLPTLVIMEGLLMYLEREEVLRLLRRICERFEMGGQILADVMGRRFLAMQGGLRTISSTGAVMKSSADFGEELTVAHERLRVRDEIRMWQRDGRGVLPWYARLSLWVYSWFPGLRTLSSDMRFDF